MHRKLQPLLLAALLGVLIVALAGCAPQRPAKVTFEPSFSFVRDSDPPNQSGKTAAVMDSAQETGER